MAPLVPRSTPPAQSSTPMFSVGAQALEWSVRAGTGAPVGLQMPAKALLLAALADCSTLPPGLPAPSPRLAVEVSSIRTPLPELPSTVHLVRLRWLPAPPTRMPSLGLVVPLPVIVQ